MQCIKIMMDIYNDYIFLDENEWFGDLGWIFLRFIDDNFHLENDDNFFDVLLLYNFDEIFVYHNDCHQKEDVPNV